MIRHKNLEHRFVEHFPDVLHPGVLYVSMEYGSVAHSCCCGCGEEVVTPLTPTDWKIIYDGESISLTPSVGNWNLPCRSHYVIKQGRAYEAPSWTQEQVIAGQRRERRARAKYYQQQPEQAVPASPNNSSDKVQQGIWSRLFRRLREVFCG